MKLRSCRPRPLRSGRSPSFDSVASLFALALLGLLLSAEPSACEIRFWVDEAGLTHFTDDPDVDVADSDANSNDVDTLRSVWSDGITGPTIEAESGDSSGTDDRVQRLLRGARADLARGEISRADSTLRGILKISPRRPEAHWYLATLSRGRGRFAAAEAHLRKFLDEAGPEFGDWRTQAKARLAALAEERNLANPEHLDGPLELKSLHGDHFRVQVDARLGEVSDGYATRVMGFLEEARSVVSDAIGVEPLEPLGVVLYGRAAYVRAHAHRFSFQTIGFFDGRIHVASPAHPTTALRGILFHEYTHAVFREHTGGDRPYWLNEGLAEEIERRSRGRSVSTRSERATLRANIELDSWLPLRSIAESFAGLTDDSARDAYLESVVTAGYIEAHTDVAARRLLLERIGEGFSIDQALHEMMGLDSEGLDQAVQREIRAEFPEWNVPAAQISESDTASESEQRP